MKVTLAAESDFDLPREIKLVFLALMSVVLLFMLIMVSVTVRARVKAFNKDFMKQFNDLHKEAFGLDQAPGAGYPDCGNGYYGKRLSYQAWLDMNIGQRAQINYLEHITYVLVSGFVGGLSHPRFASTFLFVNVVGRTVYTVAYASKGP